MTCPDPDMNPFFNMPEHEKEEIIIDEIQLEESPEDESIRNAIRFVKIYIKHLHIEHIKVLNLC